MTPGAKREAVAHARTVFGLSERRACSIIGVSRRVRRPDDGALRSSGRPSDELKSFVTDRQGHERRYAIDTDKISSELGYAPKMDFAAGFAQTLKWYLDNESWWRPLLKR